MGDCGPVGECGLVFRGGSTRTLGSGSVHRRKKGKKRKNSLEKPNTLQHTARGPVYLMAENQKKINTFPQTVNYLATFHCKTNIIEVFNLVGHLGIARQTDIRLNCAIAERLRLR